MVTKSEHTAMLRQCNGFLLSWVDLLEHVAVSRHLTATERAILYNATRLGEDVARVLRGEQPVDQDNQQAIYVEHLVNCSDMDHVSR
jgi:hypothetical protein